MAVRTFFFAGGGTGGHLYPALAIAEQFGTMSGAKAHFLCSTRPLDAEILRAERAPFTPIPARPFGLSPRALARFLWHWGDSVRAARAILREAKREGEAHVVAMGGFVAAPVAQAARVERVPITLVNLDAVPGRANRWIAKHASQVFTAAPVTGVAWTVVPPIVRRQAIAPAAPARCREMLGLERDRPTLFVTGASQGAKSINRFVVAFAEQHVEALQRGRWQVIHQTGKGEAEEAREAYARLGVRAVAEPYFSAMGAAWGAADLAIARAGAGSVGEAWANRVPTVFFPYPYHKDQHQRANARAMVEGGGAILAEDLVDAGRNLAAHGEMLRRLITEAGERSAMRRALERLPRADGAAAVARALVGE